MTEQTVVIVGASHAAVQAVDTLRREGHTGRIVLVGDEPYLPYNRPPLSKKYLAGEMERERLLLRSAQFYEQHQVDVKLGLRVTAIDRADQRLRLSDGAELRYDKLILCLGSRNRLLEVPGYDLKGIHYLRTMADVPTSRGQRRSSSWARVTSGWRRPRLPGTLASRSRCSRWPTDRCSA
jgi:3-phenylpropionate/trans-cinnamate dioxygenase ferredoxin reductase subunit